MINAVGLQNPWVHHVTQHELPELKKIFHKPVIANVSGFSVEDYAYTCQLLDKEEQVGILEVNVSCPNVHGGGMSFWHRSGLCRRSDPGGKGSDHQAGVH